jgi:hypothetical protein
MDNKKTVNVFLFSEMDEDTGDVVPVQLELDMEQYNALILAVSEDITFIPFGNIFHHKDDIIKFVVLNY